MPTAELVIRDIIVAIYYIGPVVQVKNKLLHASPINNEMIFL